MNISKLDRKIVIENYTLSQNSFGESTKVWATYHTCFSDVYMMGGTEKLEGDKTTATVQVRFKIRYYNGINESMRILYNSTYYDIIEIQELDREGLYLKAARRN